MTDTLERAAKAAALAYYTAKPEYGEPPAYKALAWERFVPVVEAALAAMWRPIETAPKDGAWFVALARDGHLYRVSWGKNHRDELAWCTVSYSFVAGYLRFWMPLPAPPSEEAE